MKKTVVITGATGMLGSMMYRVLDRAGYRLVLVVRNRQKLALLNKTYGNVASHRSVEFDASKLLDDPSGGLFYKKAGPADAVINCAGVIIPNISNNPLEAVAVNSVFPHMLSRVYTNKLIHVTTDCVFDGKKGAPYTESAVPSPVDTYGITKLLGEVKDRSLVIRTSFIGPELGGASVSLYGWLMSNRGKTVKGYVNHLWNGLTTKEFARCVDTILSDRSKYPDSGLFHVFSTDMTKYDMLMVLNQAYRLNIRIIPKKVTPVDRRLRSTFDVCKKLRVCSYSAMVADLIR